MTDNLDRAATWELEHIVAALSTPVALFLATPAELARLDTARRVLQARQSRTTGNRPA